MMELLVKLSFSCFAAATVALAGAAVCYAGFAVDRVVQRRATFAASAGHVAASAPVASGLATTGLGRFATLLAWFGVAFQGLALVLRAIVAQRGPYANMYEFSLAFVFAAVVISLAFERWYGVRHLGAIVLSIAVGMNFYVWSLPAELREVRALIPALQNPLLLTAHVTAAVVAYATFAVAFAAAVLFLLGAGDRVPWLPHAELLDDLGFRAVTIGFPAMSLVLILGSVWASQAWGTYWLWDPKETAALFTWLLYAVYLHSRSLRGWRGRRSAMILLVAFGAVVFTYFGNYIFEGLHAYGGTR